MTSAIDDMMTAMAQKKPKVPVPPRSAKPVTPEAKPAPAPRAQAKATGGLSGRLMRVQLTAEQERWLLDVVGDAYKSGRRVSEAAIVRLAVERLRSQGGWNTIKSQV